MTTLTPLAAATGAAPVLALLSATLMLWLDRRHGLGFSASAEVSTYDGIQIFSAGGDWSSSDFSFGSSGLATLNTVRFLSSEAPGAGERLLVTVPYDVDSSGGAGGAVDGASRAPALRV